MQKNKLAILAIVLATGIGASSGLYIKTLPFSSLALTGFRMGIPFLFFLPLMIKRGLILGSKENRKDIILASVFNSVRMLLYIMAYKLTTMTNAVVLLYMWPIFALFISGFINKEPLELKEILLLLLALTGVVLLNINKGFSLSSSDITGSILMILSALLYAMSTLLFKNVLNHHSEGEVLYFQNALGAIVFIPFLLMEIGGAAVVPSLTGVFYGFTVGIIAFGCFFYALKRVPIFQYGTLGYLEVVFGVLFGIFIFSESLTPNRIVGLICILSSSILSRFYSRKNPDKT